jgi:hypothetical protein
MVIRNPIRVDWIREQVGEQFLPGHNPSEWDAIANQVKIGLSKIYDSPPL